MQLVRMQEAIIGRHYFHNVLTLFMLSPAVDLESIWLSLQDYSFVSVLTCYKVAYTMQHRVTHTHTHTLEAAAHKCYQAWTCGMSHGLNTWLCMTACACGSSVPHASSLYCIV